MDEFKKEKLKPDQNDLDLEKFNEGQTVSDSWAKKVGLLVFEVVKIVLISLAIIVPVRLFLVQPFYVEGASMEPNFYNKDYLVINEISYRFANPQRGDVVVFKSPDDGRVYFIKRVIGLPGEDLEIRAGHVFINSKELKETYIARFSSDEYAKITLKDNQYFVLGDNRTNSHDSRRFGAIGKERIIGKAWFRGWPIDRLNTFNLPIY